MTPGEQLAMALHGLRSNWLRGVLTALGVIIGVASLVALTAISAGAQAGVQEDLERLGPNIVILDGEFVVQPDGTQSATDRTLTVEDLAAVADLDGVTGVAPRQNVEGLVISSGRVQASPILSGITPRYQSMHNYRAQQGRLLTGEDGTQGLQVVVLGERPAQRLFPGGRAVGRSVRSSTRCSKPISPTA